MKQSKKGQKDIQITKERDKGGYRKAIAVRKIMSLNGNK